MENSLGKLFTITSFGESHGRCVGVTIDGCPTGLALTEEDIQREVNKNSVVVRKSKLNAIRADLSDCIDLLPTMAVLAAVADGESEFIGIDRARLKESNRVSALREGLERMGIKVKEENPAGTK